jgi:Holliday junction resolvase RusA-like endonuclease
MKMALRSFSFTVWDKPLPLSRPRFARIAGGGVRTYAASKDQTARFHIRSAWLRLEESLLDGPLRLEVEVLLPLPKMMSKKKRKNALPVVRPDLDNYIKQVLDALQGYAFADDKQVVTIIARKRYAGGFPNGELQDQRPRWEIKLDEIEIGGQA